MCPASYLNSDHAAGAFLRYRSLMPRHLDRLEATVAVSGIAVGVLVDLVILIHLSARLVGGRCHALILRSRPLLPPRVALPHKVHLLLHNMINQVQHHIMIGTIM